ncbi:MAG: hypothetical protein Q8P41_21645 [Pseudomonadota bacterium]|nr:hypothetical protein [Pseudomonadota bacterium]
MIRIELTEEEAERLHIALQNYIGELGAQISATDLLAFREELKAARALLRKVDQQLSEPELA